MTSYDVMTSLGDVTLAVGCGPVPIIQGCIGERTGALASSQLINQIVFSNSLCFSCPTLHFPCANLHNL